MKGMVSEVIAQDMKRLDAAKERMRLLLSTGDSALAKPYPTVGLLELAADEIEALRDALWRPIATVPTNEPVLVYAPANDDLICVAIWTGEHWRGRIWLEPLYWMALPERPQLETKP